MKSFNPLQYRQLLWTAGGGGGGGGGGDCCFETITVAALQALISGGTLEAGRTYLVTDVSADWQVMTRAMTISSVTTQCNAIYQGSLYVEAWWDAMTNTLWKIYDPKFNNEVEGPLNIAQFTWNDASWFDNKILAGSTFISGVASLSQFNGNVIGPGSTWDMTNVTATNISFNVVSGNSTVSMIDASIENVVSNRLDSGSSMLMDGASLAGVSNNSLSASSFLGLQNAVASGLIYNNSLDAGTYVFLTCNFDSFYRNSLSAAILNLSGGQFSGFYENIVSESTIILGTGVFSSIASNEITGKSSVDFTDATITTITFNRVSGGSEIDANSATGTDWSYNTYEQKAVVNYTECTFPDQQNNRFVGGSVNFYKIDVGVIKYNVFKEAYISNPELTAVVNIAEMFRNNIFDSTIGFTSNGAWDRFNNNTVEASSVVTIFGPDTIFTDNIIKNNSSIVIDKTVTIYEFSANTITQGSQVTISGNSTIDSVSQSSCTNRSILEIQDAILPDCEFINVSNDSTFHIIGVANTLMSQVSCSQFSVITLTSCNLNEFQRIYVGLNSSLTITSNVDNSAYSDLVVYKNSSIELDGCYYSLFIKFNLISSSFYAQNVTAGRRLNFDLIRSDINDTDLSGGDCDTVSSEFSQWSIGNAASLGDVKIIGKVSGASITGAHGGRTAIAGSYSNFQATLDMSDVSIFSANTLYIPSPLEDYVGEFELINAGVGTKIDNIVNSNPFTWPVTFMSASSLQFRGGAGNIYNNGGGNRPLSTVNDFVQYKNSSGAFFETNYGKF
jgi:hypothetical protein